MRDGSPLVLYLLFTTCATVGCSSQALPLPRAAYQAVSFKDYAETLCPAFYSTLCSEENAGAWRYLAEGNQSDANRPDPFARYDQGPGLPPEQIYLWVDPSFVTEIPEDLEMPPLPLGIKRVPTMCFTVGCVNLILQHHGLRSTALQFQTNQDYAPRRWPEWSAQPGIRAPDSPGWSGEMDSLLFPTALGASLGMYGFQRREASGDNIYQACIVHDYALAANQSRLLDYVVLCIATFTQAPCSVLCQSEQWDANIVARLLPAIRPREGANG